MWILLLYICIVHIRVHYIFLLKISLANCLKIRLLLVIPPTKVADVYFLKIKCIKCMNGKNWTIMKIVKFKQNFVVTIKRGVL